MKNVYTSWDLNLLADKMIERILDCWENPFESPVVIFTDPKIEQWFKLHWLKNPKAGKSVLMNLKMLRIQQFLFDLVIPRGQKPALNIEKLSVELLRDVIITKLTGKNQSGNYYFETLGSNDVINYLINKIDGGFEINTVRLYDFAQEIASLFLDYEDTRPDCLKELLEESDWQKKLYHDVISEKGVCIEDTAYMTLFQLVQLNKKINKTDTPLFNWNKNRPVFIFGFSGLGQIYRTILSDFSKDHQLEVFMQTSASSSGEAQNQLVQKWAEYGNSHLSLWCRDTKPVALSAETSFTKEDTLLHRVQKTIAVDQEFSPEAFNKEDSSLTLTAAPTKLREVEAVHSRICRLLNSKSAGDLQLGDFLVVAPHIQDYKTAIEQVFDQTDRTDADSPFPYIPYCIADYSGDNSLSAEALNVFFRIIKNGYLSRSDVFALLRNYLVQSARGISDSEVSDWSEWISQLKTFRDRAGHEDWEKAKNRLLLSKLTDKLTDEYLPYENLATENNDSLYRFIQAIDELEAWTQYSKKSQFSASDIDDIREILENWLLLDNDIPNSLYHESLLFQNITEEIERQKKTSEKVYSDCFFFALLDRSHTVSLHNSNIFAQGITFANFESNRVLSAKYVFFMGLDSNIFPGVDSDNVLDLRSRFESLAGDESIPHKNKNAFLCQLMAAQDGFFISYINKDLQKDEDFYKSSVLHDLFSTLYNKEANNPDKPAYEIQLDIDETREWKELYTQREFRNKKNYIEFQNSTDKPQAAAVTAASESDTSLPDRVTISQIKDYLNDPFQFMVKTKFNKNDDDSEEELIEFEPIFLNNLITSRLKKEFIQHVLQFPEKVYDKDELQHKLEINNLLPDSFFGDAALEKIFTESQKNLEAIPQTVDTSKLTFGSNILLTIHQNHTRKKEWYLSGELTWHNENFTDTKIFQSIEFNNSDSCLNGYLSALACIAALPEEDKSNYMVELYVIAKKDSAPPEPQVCLLNRNQAIELLKNLYSNMFIEKYSQCIPYALIRKTLKQKKSVRGSKEFTFYDFSSSIKDSEYGVWSYFQKAKLFSIEKDLKYTSDNFQTKWTQAMEKQLNLMPFLIEEQKEEN